MNEQIIIDERDNVAVLLTEKNGITRGQKIALRAIAKGEQIVKYGYPIGVATATIQVGAHVHTQNMRTALGDAREKSSEVSVQSFDNSGLRTEDRSRSFPGYRRANGHMCGESIARFIDKLTCAIVIFEPARLAVDLSFDVSRITYSFEFSA